jgi:hypothetical protein
VYNEGYPNVCSVDDFNCGPGHVGANSMAFDQLFDSVKTMNGFKQAICFGDNAYGIFNSLVIWGSKQDAEAALAINAPGTTRFSKRVLSSEHYKLLRLNWWAVVFNRKNCCTGFRLC